jgi:hypothetical protein
VIFKDQIETTIDPYGKKAIPYTLTMPQQADGYLLLSEYTPAGSLEPVISRRYIKVGSDENYAYPFFDR